MKILKESFSNSAWCISRSGKVIPLRVHPFGALDDDSTEDAAWLYVVIVPPFIVNTTVA